MSQVEDPGDEQADVLLDPKFDPGGGAMGTMGADGSVETNWFALLHRRVTDRAVRSPRYQWWALVALLAGLLSLNITFTVFVVALPTVKADFNTNFSVLAWASTGPLLAFGVAAPFFGKAGDLFGHRRLYQFGLLGAMVSAILTATAPNVGMLLFARALDGVQGAATGTASMAIILELFSRQDRVKALGWWSLVGAGGPVLGVTLGSPVIQFFGWRTLFWGQLVLLVIASVVVALLLPSDRRAARCAEDAARRGRRRRRRARPACARRGVWDGMDWVGIWSLAGSVTAAMLVLSIGPIVGWTSPAVIVSGVVAVVAGRGVRPPGADLRHPAGADRVLAPPELHVPHGHQGVLELRLLRRLLPVPAPDGAGLRLQRVPGRLHLGGPAAPVRHQRSHCGLYDGADGGAHGDALRHRSLLLSMILFATLRPSAGLLIILVALALSGLGMGVSMPATSATMSNELAASEYGVMSAAQLLATQVGEVAGIQAVLTIQESIARRSGLGNVHHSTALLHSFSVPFWVGAGVAALAVVCALFIRPLPRAGAGRAAGWPTPAERRPATR